MNLRSALLAIACLVSARQVQAQACPRVDVTSYKTLSNSWTDAFNDAVTAQVMSPCTGGAVYVPAGTYAIGTVDVPSKISFEGDGRSSVVQSTGAPMFLVKSGTSASSDVTFRNLAFDLNVQNNFTTAIQFGDASTPCATAGDRLRIEGNYFYSSSCGRPVSCSYRGTGTAFASAA